MRLCVMGVGAAYSVPQIARLTFDVFVLEWLLITDLSGGCQDWGMVESNRTVELKPPESRWGPLEV